MWVRTCPDRDAFSEEVKLEHLQQVFLGFTMGFGFDDAADDIDPCSWLLYEQPGHLYFPVSDLEGLHAHWTEAHQSQQVSLLEPYYFLENPDTEEYTNYLSA